MAKDVEFDTRDLEQFGAVLGRVGSRTLDNLKSAFEVTARYVKDDARKNVRWNVGRRLAPLVNAINYDVDFTLTGLRAEIGYDRNKPQGELAHIIEYGSPAYGEQVPNAPQRNLAKAMEKNIDDFMLGVRKAALDGFD